MKRVLAIFVVAVGLVACQSGSSISPDQGMAITCSSYNEGLRTATIFHDDLSESQKETVDGVVATVGPTCAAWAEGTTPASADLVTTLQASLANLLAVTREVQ